MANKDDDLEIKVTSDENNSSDDEEIPNKTKGPKKKKQISSKKSKGLRSAKKTYDGNGTDKSALKHQHEGGIETKTMDKILTSKGKFTFCFTGGQRKHLLKGIEVSLDTKMTPEKVRNHLEDKMKKEKIDMNDKQLIIYLPGGLPFISGTLDTFFQNKDFSFNRVIYGILTQKVSEDILNTSFPELCNINGPDRQLLISPLCESSELGLSDMACLLGYLNHDGAKSDLLLRTCAAVINFPPLLTSMSKIINRNDVDGRTVITVTSTLYTFFRSYIPSTTADEKVFEYALRLCNLISHINKPPENIPIQAIDVDKGHNAELNKILSDLNLGPIVYLWKGDIGEDFKRISFELVREKAISNAYNIIASFRPIAPLSMRLVSGCSIVKGKDHEYLYIMQSASKKASDQNNVDIIDPLTGLTLSVDVEKFAAEQENDEIDNVDDLIDPYNVQQIIMVNFDESGSMKTSLYGDCIEDGEEFSRFSVAYQYLTTFVNRTYGYRIQCIQGLLSFADDIRIRCPLSPLCPDFEDKGLKNLQPEGNTKLWDSLDMACDIITKFRKDEEGNEKFENAVSRILVISDGEDTASDKTPLDIVPKLIENKIKVDCVFASLEDYCKELAAVCHMTGGLAFRPETVNDGLSLFELDTFLNYKERSPNTNPVIKTDLKTTPKKLSKNISMITADFMDKAKEEAEYDKEVKNKNIMMANATQNLATPAHQCSNNQNDPRPRNRRILRELHLAAEVNDDRSDNSMYDPDLKIFTYKTYYDKWKVFIKGPEGTPYADKWWHLLVTFPETYPVDPPVIRFVSIPYNFNVSKEGRICLNSLEKGYMSTKHVVDILQEIKEIFLLPNPESAIQLEKLELFTSEPDKYTKKAKESTDEVAKDKFEDFIDGNIDKTVNNNFTLKFDSQHIPQYMMSQISGSRIRDPVLSSTNVWYDRAELRQLVASNKNPVCVITGKRLTEALDDI